MNTKIETLDVVETRRRVVEFLEGQGYQARDADGTDFAHPDTDVRFKVGTVYREVTVTVWQGPKQIGAERVNFGRQVDETLDHLALWMAS